MRVGFVLRLTLVFFAAGGPAEAVQGQVQEPRLRMAVDATQVTVGGRLRLTVAVEHDPEAAVQWPDSLDLGPFEVLEAGAVPPTREGDRMVTAAVFTLTAFELGELEIPSFELIVAAPDGSETVLPTDPFVIEVVSVGLDEGSDIRDVKGPLSIPLNVLLLWPWLLALLVAAAGGYWMARRIRRDSAEEAPSAPEAPPRPPHEIAYEALEWLEASPLLRQGRIKEYYIEVSDIIRRYIEGRYSMNALEMTTHEVLWRLDRAGVRHETHARFTEFLEACDLVKFAKHRPSPAGCGDAVSAARGLVDATHRVLPPEPQMVPDGTTPQGDDDGRAESEPGREAGGAGELQSEPPAEVEGEIDDRDRAAGGERTDTAGAPAGKTDGAEAESGTARTGASGDRAGEVDGAEAEGTEVETV